MAVEPLYLSIDQGGHASRAIVLDGRGGVRAQAQVQVPESRPRDGWVEQDPEAVVASIEAAVATALGTLPAGSGRLAAAGLATQRSSVVCWERETGRPLSPILSWQDRRAADRVAALEAHAGAVRRATGLFLSAHYGASKLRWCLENLPEVERAHREGHLCWGPLAGFLAYRLALPRSHVIDPANASRTLLWNLKKERWDPFLLELFDLPADPLPACVPTLGEFGLLETPRGPVPLRAVTGDQSAALFAWGEPRADAAYVNLGTGAFIQVPIPSPARVHPRLLAGIALRDTHGAVYVQEGTVNGAGSALRWLERETGLADVDSSLAEWLSRGGSGIPLFLNGVSGLGTPFMVPDFPPHFTSSTDSWKQAVAVAESILFLLQTNLDCIRESGSEPAAIVAGGGLSRLDGLCRRLADLSGLPVQRPADCEATARGTAFLLAGRPPDWPAAAADAVFNPSPNPALLDRYARWKEAMQEALPPQAARAIPGVSTGAPSEATDHSSSPLGSFIRAVQVEVDDACRGRVWILRLPFLVWFAWILVHHWADPEYRSLWAGLNLGIHEWGHPIFGLFGEFIGVLGGSLMQCLAPVLSMGMFIRQRDYFAIAVCFGWLADNLFEVATYIGDARTMALPLVSPGGGECIHDWNWLLGRLGMLRYDGALAFLTRCAATGAMAVCLAGGAWLLWRMTRRPSTSSPPPV